MDKSSLVRAGSTGTVRYMSIHDNLRNFLEVRACIGVDNTLLHSSQVTLPTTILPVS